MWDNGSTATERQLDAIHIEAVRIISGATKLCGIDKLGLISLKARRDKLKLIIFYKILHGLALNYLAELVPPLVTSSSYIHHHTSSSNLKNSDHIQNFQANTNLFSDSFFPCTIRAWNSLPDDVKQAPSIDSYNTD